MLIEYGTWRVEWGPGSPRPGHFMVYRCCGDCDEYMGTYLTLSGAIKAAKMWDGCSVSCKRDRQTSNMFAQRFREGTPNFG